MTVLVSKTISLDELRKKIYDYKLSVLSAGEPEDKLENGTYVLVRQERDEESPKSSQDDDSPVLFSYDIFLVADFSESRQSRLFPVKIPAELREALEQHDSESIEDDKTLMAQLHIAIQQRAKVKNALSLVKLINDFREQLYKELVEKIGEPEAKALKGTRASRVIFEGNYLEELLKNSLDAGMGQEDNLLAREFRVHISLVSNKIKYIIEDDGPGFTPDFLGRDPEFKNAGVADAKAVLDKRLVSTKRHSHHRADSASLGGHGKGLSMTAKNPFGASVQLQNVNADPKDGRGGARIIIESINEPFELVLSPFRSSQMSVNKRFSATDIKASAYQPKTTDDDIEEEIDLSRFSLQQVLSPSADKRVADAVGPLMSPIDLTTERSTPRPRFPFLKIDEDDSSADADAVVASSVTRKSSPR